QEVDRSMSTAEKQRRGELTTVYAKAASPEAMRLAGFTYRVVSRSEAGNWDCAELSAVDPQMALARRSFADAIWQARQHLSPRWSVRRLLRRRRRTH
ncbi:MAG TPA: hypothetical protein VF502_19480, partial [Stellaceae bacterium]